MSKRSSFFKMSAALLRASEGVLRQQLAEPTEVDATDVHSDVSNIVVLLHGHGLAP